MGWDGEGCQYSLFMQNNSLARNQYVKRVCIKIIVLSELLLSGNNKKQEEAL